MGEIICYNCGWMINHLIVHEVGRCPCCRRPIRECSTCDESIEIKPAKYTDRIRKKLDRYCLEHGEPFLFHEWKYKIAVSVIEEVCRRARRLAIMKLRKRV